MPDYGKKNSGLENYGSKEKYDRGCFRRDPYLTAIRIVRKRSSSKSTLNYEHSNCGVPQGSNLGLLSFTLIINSLLEFLQYSKGLFYADDFKIFKTVPCETTLQ